MASYDEISKYRKNVPSTGFTQIVELLKQQIARDPESEEYLVEIPEVTPISTIKNELRKNGYLFKIKTDGQHIAFYFDDKHVSKILNAIDQDDSGTISEYIEKNIDLELADYGKTLLIRASELGSIKCVKVLVENGANIYCKYRPNDSIPLLFASQNGHVECLKLLLSAGTNVNYKNLDGYTALDFALVGDSYKEGNEKCALELIKYGANTSAEYNKFDVLHKAIKNSYVDIVKILISSGTDINRFFNEPYLFTAIGLQKTEIIKILINHGADVNVKYKGKTPLDIATSIGRTDYCELLRYPKIKS